MNGKPLGAIMDLGDRASLRVIWNTIALRLNQRPRKTLGFETPADRLQAVLH
jgi:hypothetical protein